MNKSSAQKATQPSRKKRRPRNRKRQKKSNPNRSQQLTVRSGYHLSPCSVKYLRVLSDPFGFVDGACVPDDIIVRSRKFYTLARPSFVVGTNGFGCISIAPTTFARDLPTAIATQSSYAGITVPVFTAPQPADTSYIYNLQNPFVFTQFVPTQTPQTTLKARLVGFGVRARYIGTQLNLAGRLVISLAPQSASFSGLTVSDVLTSATARSYAVTSRRSWQGLAWMPQSSKDYDYSDNAVGEIFLANVGTADDRSLNSIIVLVDGGTPGTTFEVEMVSYFEYTQISGLVDTTPSHSDVPGMSAIRNVIESDERVPTPGPSTYSYYMNMISRYAGDAISSATPYVLEGARKYVNQQLNRSPVPTIEFPEDL